MVKKHLLIILLVAFLHINIVKASTTSGARIGNTFYDNLVDAISKAGSNDTITLTTNANLNSSILINKTVNLNLNGHTVSAPSSVFKVQGGILNIAGSGVIKETEPNYGAIMVIGSTNPLENDYSVVNVGENITLEGWSGIFINHNASKSYGTLVNLSGKINAINDTAGSSGVGIYINGNIQHPDNHPIINILDTSEINSNGTGLYAAGFTTLNIGKAGITGLDSGISVKSGVINIDGAMIYAKGKDTTPTEGYNNGINSSGAAIQIESNSGYAGNIELNFKNGTFKSKYGNVIYEYLGKGANTQVNSINIKDGNFLSEASKAVFNFSDVFKEKHKQFISGGYFSSDITDYLKSEYTISKQGNTFVVTSTTMKEISSSNNSTKNTNLVLKIIIIITSLIITAFVIYYNRYKILKLLSI